MKETAPALAGYDRPREHIDRGIIETVEYASETVGNFRKATIYTPPGYGDDKTYNVLYLLHGIGGDESEWHRHADPQTILDNLCADGKLAPMIVVFPNGRAMPNDRAEGDLFDPDKVKAFETFEFRFAKRPDSLCRVALFGIDRSGKPCDCGVVHGRGAILEYRLEAPRPFRMDRRFFPGSQYEIS